MKKTVSIFAMLLLVMSTMAQTSLRGRVVTADGDLPILGARVTLTGQEVSTTTNAAGEFSL